MIIAGRPFIKLEVTIALTEEEARAVEALGGYGADAFIKHFYTNLGTHYMKDHEAGLRSFLDGTRGIKQFLDKAGEARSVFNGYKVAKTPERSDG